MKNRPLSPFVWIVSGLFAFHTNAAIEDGLIGYWPLNGDALDYSVHSNDGTLLPGASFVDNPTGAGQVLQTVHGAANTGHVRVGLPASFHPGNYVTGFTTSGAFWVMFDDRLGRPGATRYQPLLGEAPGLFYVDRYLPNNRLQTMVKSSERGHSATRNTWPKTSPESLSLEGRWYHIAWTFESHNEGQEAGHFRWYIDGVPSAEFHYGLQTHRTSDFRIGADHVNYPNNSRIAEVRLYDRILSAAEVAELAGEARFHSVPSYPSWWGIPEGDSLEADYLNGIPAEDVSPAMVGQLKYMASEARDALRTQLAAVGGAGPAIDSFVDGFTAADPDDREVANIGQLQESVYRFYDRFAAIGFGPGDVGWPVDLILDKKGADQSPRYPWMNDLSPQADSPALLGQLKYLHSWDLLPWTRIDSDNSGRGNGLPDWWEAYYSDQFGVFPKPLTASLTHRESTTRQLYLNNPVSPHANFTVTLSNNLAGEQVVYEYEDSLTGAVSYNWTEIATTGTRLSDISEVDNAAQEVVLNNFTFPFYGTRYDRVYISSNGLLTFGSPNTASGNRAIPEQYGLNNFIALFWDDLDTNDAIAGDGGDVYYQEFADKIIVQYDRVMRDSDSDRATQSNTFQAVLHTSGRIDAYYKDMGGYTGSASLGIEDSSGTNGIEVLYNRYRKIHPTFALSSRLALSYMPQAATFAQVSPLTGTTTTGATSTLNVTFHSFDLAPGTYTAEIGIAHSGTGTSPWNIPAVLEVTNPPASISITSPSEGTTIWSDQSMRIRVYATDDDFGIDRVEFFHDETKFAEDANPSYYRWDYYWANPIIGRYALTARAVDPFGTVTISDPVNVTVLADSDGDRLEDPWEILYFSDLSQGALDDDDGDGAVNRLEYDRGTDPSDDTQTPINQPSVIRLTEPQDAYSQLGSGHLFLRADVSDPDSELERVDFYYGPTLIGSDTSIAYGTASRRWSNPPPGTHSLVARAVDIYGTVTISDAVTITIFADSDGDRMDDAWEQRYFSDLSQGALDDDDGDGAVNRLEYDRGTDPSDDTQTPINQPSVIRLTEPQDAYSQLGSGHLFLRADVSDPDSELERVDFYYGPTLIGSDTSIAYGTASRRWSNPPPGTHSLVARAVDIYGTVTTSDAVTITVLADSDRDHIGDAWERQHFGDLESAHGDGDNDRDGLSNRNEFQAASNPLNADSDGDGYGDYFEFTHATEINSATDTDSNDIPDGVETYYDMDPAINVDTDADGLPDDYETAFGLTDPAADADNDGLSNLQEYQLGTRPDYFDTDGDLYADGFEYFTEGFDPLVPQAGGTQGDLDGDGLSDFEEMMLGTNPSRIDSDCDGYTDKEEVDVGSYPLVSGDYPLHPPTTSDPDCE